MLTNSFYSSVPGCLAVDGADHDGVAGAYKIIAGTGVTVTPSTLEDVQHGGVKYLVSGKDVTLTMPAADVTISAN